MIPCQKCRETQTVNNGFVRGKPRYKCRTGGDHFVRGDARHAPTTAVKKALAVI